MKVRDIVNKLQDISQCRDCLEDWAAGKINDPNRIAAITDDIDNHLDDYREILLSMEAKWE